MSSNDFERWRREYNREVERVNRENQRRIDEYNREVARDNQRRVDEYNREMQRRVDEANRQIRRHNDEVKRHAQREQDENVRAINEHNRQIERVNQHNRQVDARNKAVIDDLARTVNSVQYSPEEDQLAQRVADMIAAQDPREWDVFLSYAQIDGAEVGRELCAKLQALGVRVWFDEVVLQPGVSQALQMDKGLAMAHCGIALLTPAYLAGRFWTERELGALLSKSTLIPVLHGVTFAQVREYSGILPDLVGFETANHSLDEIADKIAAAVIRPKAA
jgi:hypothetical protein